MMLEWAEPRLIKLSKKKVVGKFAEQCEPGQSNTECWDGMSASAECDVGDGF